MTALAKTLPEAPKGAEGFLARYAGLRRRLPGDDAVREAAASVLPRHGLSRPARRGVEIHRSAQRRRRVVP